MTRPTRLNGESSARSMLRVLRREPSIPSVVLAAGGDNLRYAMNALNRHVKAGNIEVRLHLTKTGRAFLKSNGG